MVPTYIDIYVYIYDKYQAESQLGQISGHFYAESMRDLCGIYAGFVQELWLYKLVLRRTNWYSVVQTDTP